MYSLPLPPSFPSSLYNIQTSITDSGTPLTKKGYLNKGPFPSDGGISVSMKTYRKRYTVLTGGPNIGGYFINFYKVRQHQY